MMNILMGVLLTLAVVELIYALVTRKAVHSFRDTIASLTLGIGQQAINIYLSASFLGFYVWIHQEHALFHLAPDVWWHWLVVIILADFCYYVGHRTAHNVNFWVAGHIVHHQALDFNHMSAMRQSWTAWIVMFPFFVWLSFFVPLEMFVVGQLGNMCLQFLSHNGLFRGSLGVLDKVFVTPTNHRVHHGMNAPYLGVNCGGMFVIWDRVFGSFVEEDPANPVEIGSSFETNFYDPFEANLDYYRRLMFVSWHRKGLSRLWIWLQTPQALEADLERFGYSERVAVRATDTSAMTSSRRLSTGVAFLVSVALLGLHRALYTDNTLLMQISTGLLVMGACWVIGRLLAPSTTYDVPGRSEVSAK
jgi:alkylglycerol monooxygenase